MKNGVIRSDTSSDSNSVIDNIEVMQNTSSNYNYLPHFIRDKIIKFKQDNIYSSFSKDLSNNKHDDNNREDISGMKEESGNKNINDKNLYREFFKSNVFIKHRDDLIMPVLNVDNIDSYEDKIRKENQVKISGKNDLIMSQKYSYSLNNPKIKFKSMKPKIGENLEKFKEDIKAKQKIKIENFDPKDILESEEKRIIDKSFKIPKRLGEKNLLKDNYAKFVLENLTNEKNQTQKILDDNAFIDYEMLEFRDFVETFDNKFKKNLIPGKNFSKNIFKFDDDFYENLCHKIKNISKPVELTDIEEDFSSIVLSQESESFFSHEDEKSYVYTDGSNISEINPEDTKFFKLKNSNFKIKRNFTVTNKIKKKKKIETVFKSTLKMTRKNIKSISTTVGTLKGTRNLADIVKVNRDINESFVNASFLVENIPDEIVTHLENLKNKNLKNFRKNSQKESNKNESVLIQNTKHKNLYKELEKKIKQKNKIFS